MDKKLDMEKSQLRQAMVEELFAACFEATQPLHPVLEQHVQDYIFYLLPELYSEQARVSRWELEGVSDEDLTSLQLAHRYRNHSLADFARVISERVKERGIFTTE